MNIKVEDGKVEDDVLDFAEKHGVLPRLVMIGTTIDSSGVRRRFLTADTTPPCWRKRWAICLPPSPITIPGWAYLRFVPTAKQVRAAHKAGKKVFVFGPAVVGREPDDWLKASEAGADAVPTDYSLECRQRWRQKR